MEEKKSLQKKETREVAQYDEESLRKARVLSGEGGGTNIPFVPRIRINNKEEKKVVEVEGRQEEVKMPVKKGFLVTRKNTDGEYIETYFSEELKGGILKERYQIENFDPSFKPFFKSNEFDNFNEIIEVRDTETYAVIGEGTHKELKQLFKTGEQDSLGNDLAIFKTFVILYMDVGEEIFRFKWRLSKNNNWFDYKSKFGYADTYVAYETEFELFKDKRGDIEYWFAVAKRSKPLNLDKQLEKQMEVQKFFIVVDKVLSKETPEPQKLTEKVDEVVVDEDEYKSSMDTKIDQIPF